MAARYATAADVKRALTGATTDDEASQARTRSTAASLDEQTITDQISEAASTVDIFIGGYYTTPVASVGGVTPDPIGFWTRDIAAYLATLVFRRNAPVPQDDPVRLRYAAAMAGLTAVRDRKGTLPLPRLTEDTGTAQTGFAAVVNPYDGNLFSPGDSLTVTGGDPWLSPARYWPEGLNYG